MAEYIKRGLPIEFDKLPYVKMPEGHSEYWVGKNHSGLPPNLPEDTDNRRPSFAHGGAVKKGSYTVPRMCGGGKVLKTWNK